jgi:hypothetical protein
VKRLALIFGLLMLLASCGQPATITLPARTSTQIVTTVNFVTITQPGSITTVVTTKTESVVVGSTMTLTTTATTTNTTTSTITQLRTVTVTQYSTITVTTSAFTTSTGMTTTTNTTTTTPTSPTNTGVFVGSINSDVYHYPTCSSAQQILTANRVWFSSSSDARAHGYRPCLICKPP